MQTQTTSISCPNCNAPVQLELSQLLIGTKFCCPQCLSHIGLTADSRVAVKKVINQYTASIKKKESK